MIKFCKTPLHEAAAVGHVEMCALLLARGADFYLKDKVIIFIEIMIFLIKFYFDLES